MNFEMRLLMGCMIAIYLLACSMPMPVAAMKVSLKNKFPITQAQKAEIARSKAEFLKAAENGNLPEVERLIATRRFNPGTRNQLAIRSAAGNGHFLVVQRLMKEPPKYVDPSVNAQEAIRLAAENGHFAVVQLLMTDKRVKPEEMGNYAANHACFNGHDKIVDLLLQDARVVSAVISNGFRTAVQYNCTAFIDILIANGADPAENDNQPIVTAALMGHFSVLNRLLQEEAQGVNPAARDNTPLQHARMNQHWLIMARLLDYPSVDLNVIHDLEAALLSATEAGCLPLVDRLLTRGVNLSPRNYNFAIIRAINTGSWPLVERLLREDLPLNDPARKWGIFLVTSALANAWTVMGGLLHFPLAHSAEIFQFFNPNNEAVEFRSSPGIFIPVLTSYMEHLCSGRGISPDSQLCRAFIDKVFAGSPQVNLEIEQTDVDQKNTFEPSAVLKLWKEGHIRAALMSIDSQWMRLERSITHIQQLFRWGQLDKQARDRFHPSHMQNKIAKWAEASDWRDIESDSDEDYP